MSITTSNIPQQMSRRNRKRRADIKDLVKTYGLLTPFDSSHIRPINASDIRKPLLAEVLPLAQRGDRTT